MGVEPTQSCFAGSRRAVWLQRLTLQCPRQESSLVFDLRRVACKSLTLREQIIIQCPAEESNLVRQFRGLPCSSGTTAGRLFKCLDQDLNLDLDLRRVLCDPLHQPYPATFRFSVDRPGIEPESPVRRTGVLPLDHQPVVSSGPDESRTRHTDLARVSRLLGTCQPIQIERSVPELNRVFLLTTEVCRQNTYRPFFMQ